jgi:UDP-glucose 4-epimerase
LRVFITGVAGFIGSNLADRLLAEGASVGGIDDFSAGTRAQVPAGVDLVEGDITTADLRGPMAGTSVLFHLAAFSSVSGCQRDPERAAAVHAIGTARVLAAAAEVGVRKVIAAETSAVYEGTSTYPTPETEDCPRSFYGITKRCGGQLVEAYGRHRALPVTLLRYFNVYGPRQDYRREIRPVIPAFVMALLRGEAPVIYGDGEKRRDFIHVDDVNDFHVLALTDERTNGGVFNLGTGRATSINELLSIVQRLLGTRMSPVHRPDLEGEAPITQADISRAAALGWRPRLRLEDGIETCVSFLRAVRDDGRVNLAR